MKKKKKERPLEAVIYENNPVELELARLVKREKKEKKKKKKG